MGEKLREYQICLKLNEKEFMMLEHLSASMFMKRTEVLRFLIREKAGEIAWQKGNHIY